MKRTNRICANHSIMALGIISALTLAACSAEPGVDEGPENEGATATGAELAVDESSVDPSLAEAIAVMKAGDSPRPTLVKKFAPCDTNGPTSRSVRNNNAPSGGAARQRSGSSTKCLTDGVLQTTDDALYFCWTWGDDGYTWTYNENLRTGVRGWTRDDLLDDYGAPYSYTCGFSE